MTSFNSRTCEGATFWDSIERILERSFNSRTCEGATSQDKRSPVQAMVSIHAPVKVRPFPRIFPLKGDAVSIHAPVKVRPPEVNLDKVLV